MSSSGSDTSTTRLYAENWLGPIDLRPCYQHEAPLEIDVGCGKGRFLLARSAAFPDTNFLGIDRMLRRIRKVDRKLIRRSQENVRLLRMEAYYAVSYLIPPTCVSTYYIFFPDPWPKKKHASHRLFDVPFMDAMCRTMKPDAMLHFATDHQPYFQEVHTLLQKDKRFTEAPPFMPTEDERTDFELIFTGKPIGRCSFKFLL
ncbi:MAG: tRNA (guanosine(46)-N7)-methyltransferase TrmB [Spartobacteria bacterium]|nr:tRNA (guanosine(46)-N7)-methyltransferase TrmB [Spartobacteria bacterium]